MKKLLFRTCLCTLAALFCSLSTLAACANETGSETSLENVGSSAETVPDDAAEQPDAEEKPPRVPAENEADASTDNRDDKSPSEDPASEETNAPQETEEIAKPAQAHYILIMTNDLNVRAGAGTSYAILGQAERNTLLKYEGETADWYKTFFRNETAYVSARTDYTSLVTMETGSETVEAVIGEGAKLLGTAYVYGAVRLHDGNGTFYKDFTASKFDCSSLMQYIFYYGAGVFLATTTRTQVLQGTTVSKDELNRGDLLFFTNSSRADKTGIERIGHVALYLGDNYILHTSSDYAKIEQISVQRWNYFIAARRML